MAEPFIGEIRIFSFNFAPRGWAICSGQILAINQNQALFSLLGTQFGGNGQTTFALPDFRQRTPIGFREEFPIGSVFGESAHALTTQEMPPHSHSLRGTNVRATTASPSGGVFANPFTFAVNQSMYASAADGLAGAAAVQSTGGSQPHPNRQPQLVVLPCIALQGIFPSRN